MRTPISRRTALRASGVALSLPLLDVMNPIFGFERTPQPKRTVLICNALGLYRPSLSPRRRETITKARSTSNCSRNTEVNSSYERKSNPGAACGCSIWEMSDQKRSGLRTFLPNATVDTFWRSLNG